MYLKASRKWLPSTNIEFTLYVYVINTHCYHGSTNKNHFIIWMPPLWQQKKDLSQTYSRMLLSSIVFYSDLRLPFAAVCHQTGQRATYNLLKMTMPWMSIMLNVSINLLEKNNIFGKININWLLSIPIWVYLIYLCTNNFLQLSFLCYGY